MKQKLLKSATLLLFVGCITLFIAYRSGKINNVDAIMQSSPNGGSLNNTSNSDSTLVLDSITLDQLMSSSKSAIILPKIRPLKDSLYSTQTDTIPDSTIRRFMIMGGSKSIQIIDKPFLKDTASQKNAPNNYKKK